MFIVRIIGEAQEHCVTQIQRFVILNHVVHIFTTVI
jgi:hypothetical protein